MDFNEFAETIKAKHPQYADRDNRTLAEAIVKKYPQYASKVSFDAPQEQQVQADPNAKFYELEKQQGLPVTPTERFKQLGTQFKDALTSPVPGSMLTAPLKAVQETSQQLGADVARKTDSRLAGFAASAATDPISYVAGPEMKLLSSVFSGVKKAGNGILKTIMKIGANRSDAAIEQGAKAGWKLPNVGAQEIETAVANAQNVLKSSVDDAGKLLNEAKTNIGLPVTAEEKELSLLKNGNVYGLGKSEINDMVRGFISKKNKPEDLANSITKFKAIANTTADTKLRSKVALSLQDQINDFVNWEKSGNQVEGLLKQQYKQLGDMVQDIMPKQVRERMARALSLKDDLGKQLGLGETEGTGKAEQFLRNLFEGKTAKAKDYLKRFADLEALIGEPVLSELFKKFAGQDLHVLAGRPFLAATAGVSAAVHPLGLGLVAAQSPRLLNAAGRMGLGAANLAEKASVAPARALRGFAMGQSSDKNKQELDKLMQRLRNAQ